MIAEKRKQLLTWARTGTAAGQGEVGASFPEFRGPRQWAAPQRFFCPTMCGCVMGYQYTFYFSADVLSKVDLLMLDWMTEQHMFNRVTPATPTNILRQCEAHSYLTTSKELFKEIWHLHGNKLTYDCGCSVSVWFDDRIAQEDRIHTPVEHPVHTNRCNRHAHLSTIDHFMFLGAHILEEVEVG